jgi:hypothetical protein
LKGLMKGFSSILRRSISPFALVWMAGLHNYLPHALAFPHGNGTTGQIKATRMFFPCSAKSRLTLSTFHFGPQHVGAS